MPGQMVQSTFQFGEVSPLMLARADSQIYYRALQKARNVLVIPQGGVTRRFGTTFVADLSSITTDYTQIKPFVFDYEDGKRYVLIFTNNTLRIFYNEVELTGTPITTTYTAAQIEALSVAQSQNLVMIAHAAHMPAILSRTADTDAYGDWTFTSAPRIITYPTYDFRDDYEALTFQVKISATPITTAQNLLGQVVNVVAGSGTPFSADHVGGLFFSEGGTIRFTAFNSTTSMTGRIVFTFDPVSALFHGSKNITGEDAVITEKAWSANRGYPEKVGFFQNRIFYGKTLSLPGGVWGSNYNGFKADALKFDDSETLDTNAISTTLQGRKAVLIRNIVGYKTIVILTSSGIFSSSSLDQSALTPTTIQFLNQQTADGSADLEAVIFDNSLIFFDKGGRKVRDLVLREATGNYATRNISVLSPHLIDSPYSAAIFENSSQQDGSWLFMCNTGSSVLPDGTALDGSLAVYQAVPEQEITAWTLSTTQGKFRHVASDETNVYFIVEREIDGATKLYLEKLDFDKKTDCAGTYTPSGSPAVTVSGLSHLEGEEVRVIADGAVAASKTVSSGTITLDDAATSVEVGLNYNPEVSPMPLVTPMQVGQNVYLPKSIHRVFVDFNESLGIKVNGELVRPFTFDVDYMDAAPIPKTDFAEVIPMNGWSPRQQLSITQSDPLPFTLIGIGLEVSLEDE